MIKIGEKTMEKKASLEENLKQIQAYLKENRFVLVDDNRIPLTEEKIIEILQSENPVFQVQSLEALERETIAETVQYVEHAEFRIQELIDEGDNQLIQQSFVELMESLVELEKISRYFSMDIISLKKINEVSQKAVVQLEQGNVSYLIDLMEFEILPMLSRLKNSLRERAVHS